MIDFVFKNARIVLKHETIRGSLHVQGGRIAGIAEGPCDLPGAVDLEGDWLIPGLVELHTDNLERCFEPRPKVSWPAEAAILAHDGQMALSGVTTVCDAVCVGFYDDKQARLALLSQSLRAIEQARDKDALACDHFLHLRLEITDPNVIPLTEPLVDEPSLVIISFMDHTPGQRQWQDISKYRQFQMGRSGKTAAEFESMLAQRVQEQELYAERHKRELLALFAHRDLVKASHDDTTAGHVEEAVRDGVTVSEFPTTMEAARAAKRHGLVTVMGAPNLVLGGSHSGNVSAGELVEEGLLDCFSSDYVPTSLLNAAFQTHHRHGRPIEDAVATVTGTPAGVLGLADRGQIALGLRADLVRVREVGRAVRAAGVWKEGRRIA
jgi:alpha-D-ribose 1-methylphosphonate 5-triphosphate diphosphatase